MPRSARASAGGVCCHVLNRGNGRRVVFHHDGDYQAFLKAIAHACVEVAVAVLSYCLLPNHFHLVVQPTADGDVSRWMHWLQNTHVRRYHQHYTSGHVWQGRFKSFPIQEDEHLLTVLRYVERNPVRCGQVGRAEDWPWSSARLWRDDALRPRWLTAGPVSRPRDWLGFVNAAATAGEMASVRQSVTRNAPFGGSGWVEAAARRHGLESTLRPRGRPRK